MSLVQEIKNPKTLNYLLGLDASLNDYMISSYFQSTGILEIVSRIVGPILKAKGISDQGIREFSEEFQKNIDPDHFQKWFTYIANPPLDIQDNLNAVTSIFSMCDYAGIYNYEWLTTFTFPGGANVGVFEAFLIVLFQKMSSPLKGDIMYGKDLGEVKGSGGRLRGQFGYDNGIISFIDEIIKPLGFGHKNKLLYNIGKDNWNSIGRKIIDRQIKISAEHKKYRKNLSLKLKRMVDASGNQTTKKYKKAKEAYEKYNSVIPRSITVLREEVSKLEEDQKNCILENVSMKLAEDSIEKSIDLFVRIFSKKYSKANMLHIEKFVKNSLNFDGTFKDVFLSNYLIFEFEYYQQIEEFKHFYLINLKEDIMLIIDSPEKFREFVESGNIVIKSSPSFSEYAGQQGMVFAIDLKR